MPAGQRRSSAARSGSGISSEESGGGTSVGSSKGRTARAHARVSEVSKVSEFDTIDTDRHDPRISTVLIAVLSVGEVSERVGAVSDWCR